MGFKPVVAIVTFDSERNAQFHNVFHFFDDDLFQCLHFLRKGVEHKFIVDLKDHLGLQALLAHLIVDSYHRQFDDVSGSPLDRSVHGIPLGKCPDRGVLGVDLRNIPPAAKKCLHVPGLPGSLFGVLDEGLD